MNAPTKFRVWDGEEMHYPPHDYVRNGSGVLFKVGKIWGHDRGKLRADGAEAMDHTGLDDAEGTPIYEGDVVEYPTSENERIPWLVRWREERSSFGLWRPGYGFNYHLAKKGIRTHDAKVLGDRYRNSDLLEEVTADGY